MLRTGHHGECFRAGSGLTLVALGARDSEAFSSISLASGFSYYQEESTPSQRR
jgi:hypothetical protein